MRVPLRKSALILALTFTFTVSSLASETTPQSTAEVIKTPPRVIPDFGYRIHGSLGAGFGAMTGGEYQSSPSGAYTLGSLGFGRRTRRWEWDTNIGWGFSARSGIDKNGNPVSIRIRSARADFSPRFRLLSFWQVGPIVTANFGTDTRFNTSLGNSVATIYGGAKTVLDLGSIERFPIQAWGEALTELSSFGRDAITLLAGFRLSLPIEERTIDVLTTSRAAPQRDIRVVLDTKKVFFKTSSAKIRPEIIQTLSALSGHLATNPNHWESVEIVGHADVRGPKEYNDQLSLRRAQSVRKALAFPGFEEQKISVQGRGFSEPVDAENHSKAWAKNRRVELTFKNVVNPAKFEALLAPLYPEPTKKN